MHLIFIWYTNASLPSRHEFVYQIKIGCFFFCYVSILHAGIDGSVTKLVFNHENGKGAFQLGKELFIKYSSAGACWCDNEKISNIKTETITGNLDYIDITDANEQTQYFVFAFTRWKTLLLDFKRRIYHVSNQSLRIILTLSSTALVRFWRELLF